MQATIKTLIGVLWLANRTHPALVTTHSALPDAQTGDTHTMHEEGC